MEFQEFEKIPAELLNTISEKEFINEHEAQHVNVNISDPSENIFTPPQPVNASPIQNNSFAVGDLIDAKTALNLVDAIIPALFAAGIGAFTKKKVPSKALKMGAQEKTNIEPAIKKIMDRLNINIDNPYIALGLVLGSAYGGKVVEVMTSIEEYESKAKEPTKNASKTTAPTKEENRYYLTGKKKGELKPAYFAEELTRQK